MTIPATTQKRLVLFNVNPSRERTEDAQIAFISDNAWSIIGPFWQIAALSEFHTMPSVHCPIVDLRPIRPEDQDVLQQLLNRHIQPAGVANLLQLVAQLSLLGAVLV